MHDTHTHQSHSVPAALSGQRDYRWALASLIFRYKSPTESEKGTCIQQSLCTLSTQHTGVSTSVFPAFPAVTPWLTEIASPTFPECVCAV